MADRSTRDALANRRGPNRGSLRRFAPAQVRIFPRRLRPNLSRQYRSLRLHRPLHNQSSDSPRYQDLPEASTALLSRSRHKQVYQLRIADCGLRIDRKLRRLLDLSNPQSAIRNPQFSFQARESDLAEAET